MTSMKAIGGFITALVFLVYVVILEFSMHPVYAATISTISSAQYQGLMWFVVTVLGLSTIFTALIVVLKKTDLL